MKQNVLVARRLPFILNMEKIRIIFGSLMDEIKNQGELKPKDRRLLIDRVDELKSLVGYASYKEQEERLETKQRLLSRFTEEKCCSIEEFFTPEIETILRKSEVVFYQYHKYDYIIHQIMTLDMGKFTYHATNLGDRERPKTDVYINPKDEAFLDALDKDEEEEEIFFVIGDEVISEDDPVFDLFYNLMEFKEITKNQFYTFLKHLQYV